MQANRNCISKMALLLALFSAVPSLSFRAQAQDTGTGLYKTKCAACHGADGKGETAMGKANKLRDLSSADVQKQSDDELTAIVTNGKAKMPAYGKSLKPDQVKELVTYIRSLAKK